MFVETETPDWFKNNICCDTAHRTGGVWCRLVLFAFGSLSFTSSTPGSTAVGSARCVQSWASCCSFVLMLDSLGGAGACSGDLCAYSGGC